MEKHLKLQPYVVHMICLFMIIIFFIMSFLYPAKSLSNLVVIAFHLFFHTYSGFNWHLLIWCLPILILVFLRKGMAKVPRFFLIITITYALFIVDIFLFRGVPLRYAIGDSGNRLIMQLYPFVVFLFFTQLTPLLVDTRVKNK